MLRVDWSAGSAALLFTLLFASAAPAQEETDVQKQLEELRKGQEQIRKDLEEIKRLLRAGALARPAAPAAPDVKNLVLDIARNPFRGDVGAGLTLVEFTDYQ